MAEDIEERKNMKKSKAYHQKEDYWYYFIGKKACQHCLHKNHQYLLKYRSYLFSWLPIFPSDTRYHIVCAHCLETHPISSEGEVAKIIQKLPSKIPFKFSNKSSDESLRAIIKKHIHEIESTTKDF